MQAKPANNLVVSMENSNRTIKDVTCYVLLLELLIEKGVAPLFREALFKYLSLIADALRNPRITRNTEEASAAAHTMQLLNRREEFTVFFFALDGLDQNLARLAAYPDSGPLEERSAIADHIASFIN